MNWWKLFAHIWVAKDGILVKISYVKKYIITIHSFVDLITNSSTELYIEATQRTIDTIKEIINNLLSLGGNSYTADNLFTIELNPDDIKRYEEEGYEPEYKDISLLVKCKDEKSELGKTTAKMLSNLTGIFNVDVVENR